MRDRKKRSVLLECIHIRLKTVAQPNGEIDRRKLVRSILGREYHIPREKRMDVIDELKELGVILDSNKFSFIINKEL